MTELAILALSPLQFRSDDDSKASSSGKDEEAEQFEGGKQKQVSGLGLPP